jgi:hypothetical protein
MRTDARYRSVVTRETGEAADGTGRTQRGTDTGQTRAPSGTAAGEVLEEMEGTA